MSDTIEKEALSQSVPAPDELSTSSSESKKQKKGWGPSVVKGSKKIQVEDILNFE